MTFLFALKCGVTAPHLRSVAQTLGAERLVNSTGALHDFLVAATCVAAPIGIVVLYLVVCHVVESRKENR